MFGREIGWIRELSSFFSEISTRRNYRADVVVVGRVHRSRGIYIGHDKSTVEHPGAMLSIHAVESVREPQPTTDQIAHAPPLPFCAIAEGDLRLDGQLVRVKGSYGVIGFHVPVLGSPANENCGGNVSLSYDEEARFTPDYHQKMIELESSFPDMTIVARVDLHRPWTNGQFLVKLMVFTVDRVEPRDEQKPTSEAH
jgi:hypothetical protein